MRKRKHTPFPCFWERNREKYAINGIMLDSTLGIPRIKNSALSYAVKLDNQARWSSHHFDEPISHMAHRVFGGDWFRHGTFELRSRSWSPRHVKQGYRQVNWQKEHSERSGARHGCLIAPGCRTRIFPDSGKVSTQGNALWHVAGMAKEKIEPTRDENVGLRTDAPLKPIAG